MTLEERAIKAAMSQDPEEWIAAFREAENDALEAAAVWLDSLNEDELPDQDGIVEGIRAFKNRVP